jgi:hypothetical protein
MVEEYISELRKIISQKTKDFRGLEEKINKEMEKISIITKDFEPNKLMDFLVHLPNEFRQMYLRYYITGTSLGYLTERERPSIEFSKRISSIILELHPKRANFLMKELPEDIYKEHSKRAREKFTKMVLSEDCGLWDLERQ